MSINPSGLPPRNQYRVVTWTPATRTAVTHMEFVADVDSYEKAKAMAEGLADCTVFNDGGRAVLRRVDGEWLSTTARPAFVTTLAGLAHTGDHGRSKSIKPKSGTHKRR